MMVRLFFILYVLFFYQLVQAQRREGTWLTGYVTIQNSNKKPAYPAELKGPGGSHTEINSDGYFELFFVDKYPGDDVTFEVYKPGYQVVNVEELNARLPLVHNLQKPVRIYLARAGEAEEFTEKAYLSFLKHFSKLKLNDSVRYQAKKLAEHFAQVNFDYLSKDYKRAFNYFTLGKLDSANFILNEQNLLQQIRESDAVIAQSSKVIEAVGQNIQDAAVKRKNAIGQLMLKAKLFATQLDWQRAEEIYLTVYKIDSLNPRVLFEISSFYEDLNDYTKAIFYLTRIPLDTDVNKLNVYKGLGVINARSGNYSIAKKYLYETRDLLQRINNSSLGFVVDYLNCLNALGNVLGEEGKYDSAKYHYIKVIAEMQEISYQYNQYFSNLISPCLNLAINYLEEFESGNTSKKIDSAEFLLNKALHIARTVTTSTKRKLHEAEIYYVLSNLCKLKKDTTQSDHFLGAAKQILEPIFLKDKRTHGKLMIHIYLALAERNKENGKIRSAAQYILNSITVLSSLSKYDSITFRGQLMSYSYDYCMKYVEIQQPRIIDSVCAACLLLKSQQTWGDTSNRGIEIAHMLVQRGKLKLLEHDYYGSESFFQQALKILDTTTIGQKRILEKSGIYNNLAIIYRDQNNKLADSLYNLSLDLLYETKGYPAYLIETNIAAVINNKGRLSFERGDYLGAYLQFHQAREVYEYYYGHAKVDIRLSLSNTKINLGDLAVRDKRFYEDAKIYYFDAEFLLKELYAINPEIHCVNLAKVYCKIADLYDKKDTLEKAKKYYDEIEFLFRKHKNEFKGHDFLKGNFYESYGNYYLKVGDKNAAAVNLNKALTYYNGMPHLDHKFKEIKTKLKGVQLELKTSNSKLSSKFKN